MNQKKEQNRGTWELYKKLFYLLIYDLGETVLFLIA
jgi:hypothetical protein